MYCSIIDGIYRLEANTRFLASNWCLEKIPVGSKIARETNTPLLPERLFDVTTEKFLAINPLEFYRENGYDYVITSSSLYGRFAAEKDLYPQYHSFYQELFANEQLLAEFKPNHLPNNIFSFVLERPSLAEAISGEYLQIYSL